VRISVISRPSHDRQRLAGVGAEQQDHGVMRRCALSLVARVEADELRPHCLVRHRRHDPEIPLSFFHRQHISHRLHDLSEREIGEGILHCRDQFIPLQQRPNPFLVQIQHDRYAAVAPRLG